MACRSFYFTGSYSYNVPPHAPPVFLSWPILSHLISSLISFHFISVYLISIWRHLTSDLIRSDLLSIHHISYYLTIKANMSVPIPVDDVDDTLYLIQFLPIIVSHVFLPSKLMCPFPSLSTMVMTHCASSSFTGYRISCFLTIEANMSIPDPIDDGDGTLCLLQLYRLPYLMLSYRRS